MDLARLTGAMKPSVVVTAGRPRKDRLPALNGNRKPEDLIHHIGTDTLVGWAWQPGFGRAPAPGTQKQAGALVEAWVKTGAVCPAR